MNYKTLKPKLCPCGIKFTPYKMEKYHSPQCELNFKTGNVDPDNMIDLPLPVLKAMATGTFQDYIKQRDKDKGCYTCPEIKGVFHASHYFKKELFSGMIFNEVATKKCCDHCNVGLDGNLPVYQEKLTKEIGIIKFIELENESIATKNYRWSRLEYIEKIELYRDKIQELKTASQNIGYPCKIVKLL